MHDELFCQTGQHRWLRPIRAGRKPDNCPEHKTAAARVANWRSGPGKERYETHKLQQRAVAHAKRRLAQRHRKEFRDLVTELCRQAKVPVPSSVIN